MGAKVIEGSEDSSRFLQEDFLGQGESRVSLAEAGCTLSSLEYWQHFSDFQFLLRRFAIDPENCDVSAIDGVVEY